MQPFIVCVTLAIFGLSSAAFNRGLEDALFDFDNDVYSPSEYRNIYRYGYRQPDDISDYESAEQEAPEPSGGDMIDRQILESIYSAKPVADVKPTGGIQKPRSYCNPPNPCPKGQSPETHACQAGVEDSADWNRLSQEQNMRMGNCACDVEHMFSCPPGVPTVSVASAKQQQQQNSKQHSKQQDTVGAKRSPVIFY